MDWLLVFALAWTSGFLLGWGLKTSPLRDGTMRREEIERRLYQ